MATKSIGLTGRDYSTLAAWASYVNALTLTGPEVGEVYNDGVAVADTSTVTINGYSGSSPTNTVTLRAAAGQSFKDDANKLTNPLRYNSAVGAALSNSTATGGSYVFGTNFILEGLMLRNTNSGASTFLSIGTNGVIRNCILKAVIGTGLGTIATAGTSITIENSVVHASGGGHGVIISHAGVVITNCLLVGTGGNGIRQLYSFSPNAIMQNTVVYGFTTDTQQTANASSTNNATSASSFGGTNWGANGQTSVAGTDFVSLTSGSEDFRLSATAAKLPNNGTTSSVTADIVGTARPQGAAYDIGPWEAAAGGAALAATPTSVSTTTAALTTSIRLAANASSVSTATGTLSDNGFNAAATSVSTATAVLTTSILLAANASSVSTATAALTTNGLAGFYTAVLKNNTGTILANETGVVINVYNSTTGALVVRKTGLTSDASGVVFINDAALVAATNYAYEVVLTTNGRRLPVTVAS